MVRKPLDTSEAHGRQICPKTTEQMHEAPALKEIVWVFKTEELEQHVDVQ